MLRKKKGMCLLYETGVEYCHNCSQVNNIIMSSNKESKAIKKEKIISPESCCTWYTLREKGITEWREGGQRRSEGRVSDLSTNF